MNFIVISLKKNFFMIIFLIFFTFLIFFSENNILSAKDGLALWVNNIVPSMFPFFVATELLCQTNFIYLLGKLFKKIMKPFFNVPEESSSALLLGTISGYPIGAKMVCNLKEKKIISKIEAERLIAYTNNSGPLFILGAVGISLFGNKKIGFILLLSHIISCLLVGFLFKNWKKDNLKIDYKLFRTDTQKLIKLSDLGEILGNAIKTSIVNILTIGGFVVLFSVIISIIETSGIIDIFSTFLNQFGIPENFTKALFLGMIELTNGVSLSSKLFIENHLLSVLLTSFLLGFGGISILFQIYSIIAKEGISIKPYVYGKFLHGLISIFITLILYILFH